MNCGKQVVCVVAIMMSPLSAFATSPVMRPFMCAEHSYFEVESAEQEEALALIDRALVAENWRCNFLLGPSEVARCMRPIISSDQDEKLQSHQHESMRIEGMCVRRLRKDFIIKFVRLNPVEEPSYTTGWRVIER